MSRIILEFDHSEIDQVIGDLQKLATVQTMAEIEATVAKRFTDRIDAMKEQIADLEKPKPKLGGGGKRWSRKYDECIKCHQADSPHASKGRCGRCYQREIFAKNSKTIIPLQVRSDGVDSRPKLGDR